MAPDIDEQCARAHPLGRPYQLSRREGRSANARANPRAGARGRQNPRERGRPRRHPHADQQEGVGHGRAAEEAARARPSGRISEPEGVAATVS
jgi:hypothetical protein